MTTHPHLEGLIRKFRERARIARGLRDGSTSPDSDWHGGMASCADICADELEALAALPGGGVGDSGDLFERAYANGYRAALGAAAAECRRQGEALDYSGNPYVRYADAIKCASAIGCLRVPEISPTPNPHEADRNG